MIDIGGIMKEIQWLFFDIGSTLVDESKCYAYRCSEIIKNNDIQAEEFYNKVLDYAKVNAFPIKTAAEEYGFEIPRWPTELEELYPGVKEILKSLSAKYKLGIIANQVAGTQERIDNWGIGKYFEVVVASAEAGCAKPDLKIFNLALVQAKSNPENAIMIGDRLDNDIAPAKKLGMKTVWVRQGFAKYQSVHNDSEKPDYIIDNISDILNIF